MKKGLMIGVIISLLLVNAKISCAEGVADKLGRGLANIATGWAEIFVETVAQNEESGHLTGLFMGPIKGTFKAIGRTFSGLCDVITCPYPSKEPLAKPDFVWQRMK